MSKNAAYIAIRNHVVDNEPLDPKHKEVYQRLLVAFTTLRKYQVKSIAVEKQKSEFNLSQAQSYRDIMHAEQIWGNIIKYSKDFLRSMIIESALEDMLRYKEIAEKAIITRETESGEEILPSANDWRIYAINMKLREEARSAAIKAGGIDKDDIEVPDYTNIQPPDIHINVPANLLDKFQGLLKQGVIDITQLQKTIDAKHEVVK